MLRRALVLLLLLALPGISLGQGPGEKYLSATTQLYLRWDGFDAHRAAFDKSAMGQLLKGDTGKFLANLWEFIHDQALPLLDQVDPTASALAKEIPGALTAVGKHGFALSVEARKIDPPQIEATFIFPRNGGPKGHLSGLVKKILTITNAETKQLKVDNVTMQHFSFPEGPLEWAFGSDGDTAIMVVGTVDPASVLRRGADVGNNITKHPLYKELQSFKEFPVWSSGFVDMAGIAKMASGFSPQVGRLVDDLGLNGLKSITMYSGFDGPADRSIVDINMTPERKGLLALTRSQPFSLKDLPPLPDDINGFSASSYDMKGMYDTLLSVAESGIRVYSPDIADQVKFIVRQAENLAGINIRDELLGSLGGMMVSYSSPSESPFLGLGGVTLLQVSDEKKLKKTLDAIFKAAPQIPFAEFEAKRKMYRGVELIELHSAAGFTTPTVCIHKGWLVYANYPQPVQGFVLRSTGNYPTWKADAATLKALSAFPKEFTGFSYSDPRPSAKFLLSLLPPIMSGINGAVKQFVPGSKEFDVSSIPHPLEVTRHLFPNISVTIDDGKKLRYDSRASLALPF